MKAGKFGFHAATAIAGVLFVLVTGCSAKVADGVVDSTLISTSSGELPSGHQCLAGLGLGAKYAAEVEAMDPIRGEGGCGAEAPVKLVSLGPGGRMAVTPPATVNCALTTQLAKWEAEVVQPSARHYFGQEVVSIQQWSSYVCRSRNSVKGARLSEHALANALDIASFTLADGRVIAVESGWPDRGKAGAFLRTLHKYACPLFGTVLGPESDSYHTNHFHLDLGRGGVCR